MSPPLKIGGKVVDLQAICFDMDGTLIHTEPIALQAVREVLQETYDVELTAHEEASMVGMAWSKVMEELKRQKQLDFDVPSFTKIVTNRYESQIKNGAPLLPHAKACVLELTQHYPLALVSGSTRHQIITAMQFHGLLDSFQFVLGIEDYLQSKPSPAGYLMAAKKLGVHPNHCLVLEDSKPGVHSGKAAGMSVIAIQAGSYTQQNFSAADLTLPSLNELLQLLRPTYKRAD